MKRVAIWMLILLLACAGVAQAAEWPEGLGPSKPYLNMPELDLSEQLGYMMFYPDVKMSVETVCQRLYIYLPREDVKAASGTFYLLTEEDGEVWRTTLNGAAVTQREITEDELDGLLWGGGTCFEIQLPRSLELGKTYFVNMERSCIVSTGGAQNVQIGGKDSWRFTVDGDYGVSGMAYLRRQEPVLQPKAGDSISFTIVLGGDAKSAAVYQYDDSVDFLTTSFTTTCEVTGNVDSDAPHWGVIFLDAEGNILKKVEFQ